MIKKALTWYTHTYAIWVLVFGAVAYWYPAPFVWMKPGMPWFFALTMFGIGLALRPEDFKHIAQHPWIVAVGCSAQFILMPLGAFLLCKMLNLPDIVAVGLVLTGAAPGAMASNVMCFIARADTAYSVSLTTVSTLLCPILTPGITLWLAGHRLEIAFVPMMLSVIKTVILPLLLGLAVRWRFHRKIAPLLPVFPAVSTTFIIFICALVIALNRERLAQVTGIILLACVILNIYGMLGGYAVASLFRFNRQRRKTLTIEIGMQNAGLGVVLALEHIGKEAAIPAALFVFVCIITASLLPFLWARGDQVEPDTA